MIEKHNESHLTIGTFTILQEGLYWRLTDNKKQEHLALYFDRDEAMRSAILLYTCGQLVADGIREMMHMVLKEKGYDKDE